MSILPTLPRSHEDFTTRKVDVFHPELQALQQPEPTSIKEQRSDRGRSAQLPKDRPHFVPGQDLRDPTVALRPNRPVGDRQRGPKHIAIQEEQRRQRLVLGGRRNPVIDGKAGEESLDVGLPQF